MTLLW